MVSLAPQKYICFAFLIFGVWASLSTASRDLSVMSMEERHEQWMARYGRVYRDAAEKARRFKIFKANAEFVESFNTAGKHKYKLATNQFADLANDEFRAAYNGFKPSKLNAMKERGSFRYENFTAAPASMDWRTKGAVTPSFMLMNISTRLSQYTFPHAESQIRAAAVSPGSMEEAGTCCWNFF